MNTVMISAQDLIIIKGVSKKNGKPYQCINIDKNSVFNNTLIEMAKLAGTRVIDFSTRLEEPITKK
jgi:hypothetical protein